MLIKRRNEIKESCKSDVLQERLKHSNVHKEMFKKSVEVKLQFQVN